MSSKQIMVALDYPHSEEALRLIARIRGVDCWLKVGMQLYYAAGPSFVRHLKDEGFSVFLDLKLHDIPNTVRGAAASITSLGVDMFNVHAAGGVAMMELAMVGAEEAAARGGVSLPRVIAVTQLTSTSQQVMNEQIGLPGTVEDAVLRYCDLTHKAGLHGVVASPHEVSRIKQTFGESFLTVTPGIRPKGAALADQVRVMTPSEAFAAGTDFIVIGRPITGAEDPRDALLAIMNDEE